MKEIDPHLPINKMAKIVVSKPKTDNIHVAVSSRIKSMAPLPTCQFTGPKIHDLTGKKAGSFIVIGFSLWRSKDKSNATRWVVRCKCGRYQLLTTKAVKKAHPTTACENCNETAFYRRRAEYLSLKK